MDMLTDPEPIFVWQNQTAFKRALRAAVEPLLLSESWTDLDGLIEATYAASPDVYGSGPLPIEERLLLACAILRGFTKLGTHYDAALVRCATGYAHLSHRAVLLCSIAETILAARADQVTMWTEPLLLGYIAADAICDVTEQARVLPTVVEANEAGAAALQELLREWNVSAELTAAPALQCCTWSHYAGSASGSLWLAQRCHQPAIWHLWYRSRWATQMLVGHWICPTCVAPLLVRSGAH